MTQQDPARVIVAVAAEADDDFIWSRLNMLPELFAAGPVAIRFGYFGAEGALSARPFIATHWATDASVLADLIDRGRTRCVCGCFVKIADILEQALQETRQAPVQAVVIIGDNFHGDLEAATATAKQLRAAGTRLFCFSRVVQTARSMRSGFSPRPPTAPTSSSTRMSSASRNACRAWLRRSRSSRWAASLRCGAKTMKQRYCCWSK
jgi:hypothetical protein